ncbi:MAG: MurR/RpiR family transcriptional regulator [Butyricicoccus sp.]
MNIEALVNQNYSRFSESDRAVWGYLSEHRAECEDISIGKMAQKSCVSRTAVMRFAQKLGFHGFAELKLYLKMDNQKTEVSSQTDAICELYQNVMQSVREKDCTALFDRMERARQVFLCGEGMVQTSIKKEFKRIFMSGGIIAYDTPSGQELHNLMPLFCSDDFCVLISVSGENEKMLALAKQLRIRGVPMLSITKNRENTLAHLCEFHLYVEDSGPIETPIQWRYESATSYFILIEILFLKYLEYKKAKELPHDTGDTGTTAL